MNAPFDPARIALSLTGHIGKKKLAALLTEFEDAAAILRADAAALQRVPGIGPKIAAAIQAVDLAAVERSLPRWRAQRVQIIPYGDPAYPRRLNPLDDAPVALFVRGDWQPHPARTVGIVGTREPTAAAREQAESLGFRLAARGYTVVSGLAYGVDVGAHRAALAAGGRTLAVLGSGVLRIYPETHTELAGAIQQYGALISEVHPDAPPNRSSLVARNRLISALSDQLIIVETGVSGGAMHAARRAVSQGRRLYAIDNNASGNRTLIDDGSARPLASDLHDLDTYWP